MRRRDVLVLLGPAALLLVRDALAQGVQPGVRRVRGQVTIDGQPARQGVLVNEGAKVVTGADAEIVFVVGRDAMLVRRNATLELVKNGFRLLTGAVLSVFAPGERRELRTMTATIGIRGTAVYVEAAPQRTYVCTCYGEAVLEPTGDPGSRETVRTKHHEQPRYIMAKGAPQMVQSAPVLNHTDAELTMLESLVGRRPPFAGKSGRY